MKSNIFTGVRQSIFLFLVLVLSAINTACVNLQPPLTFLPDKLPEAIAGQPYQVTITISGHRTPVFRIGTYESELPEGLVINHQERENTALISGILQKKGSFKFSIYASCLGTNVTGQSGHKEYELIVK